MALSRKRKEKFISWNLERFRNSCLSNKTRHVRKTTKGTFYKTFFFWRRMPSEFLPLEINILRWWIIDEILWKSPMKETVLLKWMYSGPQKSWTLLPCISYGSKGHGFWGPLYSGRVLNAVYDRMFWIFTVYFVRFSWNIRVGKSQRYIEISITFYVISTCNIKYNVQAEAGFTLVFFSWLSGMEYRLYSLLLLIPYHYRVISTLVTSLTKLAKWKLY